MMYRVLVPLLSLLLCGCSMANSSGVSAGFAASDEPTNSVPSSRLASEGQSSGQSWGQSSGQSSKGTPRRYARNDDHIPKDTFERWPSGSLADGHAGEQSREPAGA